MSKTQDLNSFIYGNSSDVGLKRSENEDSMGYFESINGHVFIVCDGMGGNIGGAMASNTAVENIRAYLENHYFDLPEDALKAAIEFANSVVFRKSKENPGLAGMGTTIVMIIIRSEKVYYAHVGDSRIYIYSGNKIHRLTKDHSLAQEMLDRGEITAEEAVDHPEKNIITRALGIQQDIEAEIAASPVLPAIGDTIMLCTDGLSGTLFESEIEEVLQQDIPVQDKAAKLTQLANEKGGLDNSTVQLIEFLNVSNKKSRFVDVSGQQNVIEGVRKEKISEPREPKAPKSPRERKPINIKVWNNLNQDWKKRLKIAGISLGVLFMAYIFWDMFIRQGVTSKMMSEQITGVDTNQVQKTDSVVAKDTIAAKPQEKPQEVKEAEKPIENNYKSDTIFYTYTIKKGDLLGKIAIKFGVPVAIIKMVNHLENDNIDLDQKLQVPIKAKHKVSQNQSLASIANKYKVEKAAIMRVNELKSDKSVKAGKELIIPYK